MFYFDKSDERVIFGDNREENHILCDGRKLEIKPDILFDFCRLPFKNGIFNHVIFDPPHLKNAGKKSWMALKYGILNKSWRDDIKIGFSEAFRVLRNKGTLIFKWNEDQILVSEILRLTDQKPIIGHRSGKQSKTHWIMFIK